MAMTTPSPLPLPHVSINEAAQVFSRRNITRGNVGMLIIKQFELKECRSFTCSCFHRIGTSLDFVLWFRFHKEYFSVIDMLSQLLHHKFDTTVVLCYDHLRLNRNDVERNPHIWTPDNFSVYLLAISRLVHNLRLYAPRCYGLVTEYKSAVSFLAQPVAIGE